ncbi:MAG: hypothetical protein US96_C0028G0022, partial [Candidatus Woesebacteria bacterium GW2011_GWB1_38_5b]
LNLIRNAKKAEAPKRIVINKKILETPSIKRKGPESAYATMIDPNIPRLKTAFAERRNFLGTNCGIIGVSAGIKN